MRRIPLFLLALVVWMLIVWPFGPGVEIEWLQDLFAGLLVALVVVAVMRDEVSEDLAKWARGDRYVWFVIYMLVLGYYIVKANLDVVYRVMHPDMPIRPGIVKVKTTLKSAPAIAALANSITLTPGTLTVNALEDGHLYVHWIYVRSEDPDEAARHITQRFEWFIRRILE